MEPGCVLTVNVGSSSVRLTAFSRAGRRSWHLGAVESEALAQIDVAPDAVVHRLVHGGPHLRATCALDEPTLAELRTLTALAPLHLPRELAWVEAARRRWPAVRALAAFDTAFYAELPAAATTYALPARLRERGFRRYGFHGLAHQDMVRQLGGYRRVISFQLGSGCSVTASRDGRPVDTSMGYSPLEGLVMATRSGDVDPGVLLALVRDGLSAEELEHALTYESGLRGLAGDGDMKALLARDDEAARLAIDVYVHRARRYLGAFLGVLGGCDAIAFGGGVGENAPAIREAILRDFAWAGIVAGLPPSPSDDDGSGLQRISARTSAVDAWIVPVDEAAVLHEAAVNFLKKESP